MKARKTTGMPRPNNFAGAKCVGAFIKRAKYVTRRATRLAQERAQRVESARLACLWVNA